MNKIEEAITTSDETTRKAFLKPFGNLLGSAIESLPGLLREFESLCNFRKATIAEQEQREKIESDRKQLTEAVDILTKAGVTGLKADDARAKAWLLLEGEDRAKYAASLGAKPKSSSNSGKALTEASKDAEGEQLCESVAGMFPAPISKK